MQVITAEKVAATFGPDDKFTGTAWIMVMLKSPIGVNVYSVFFEPKARTAWHSHPGGQILLVTSGKGRVVRFDDTGVHAFEIRPGDTVHIAPNEKHWHGAAPDNFLTHIAITPHSGGKSTDWMQKVGDDEYNQPVT